MSAEKKGPPPTGRRWNGIPIPFFFQRHAAEAFRDMEMKDDDIILSSLPKGGTTWVNRILYLIAHGIADDGEEKPAVDAAGAKHQIYPESTVPKKGAPVDEELTGLHDEIRRAHFGDHAFEEDLCGQAAPRLFSTHLYGELLPRGLISPGGRGRLIVVLRNLKDTLCSLHFFRGEAKDGWLGNEHGPGSLARFIDVDCPNAYGSSFTFVKESDKVVRELQGSGRVLVVYYEDLIRDTHAQVGRIAEFLRIPLTPEKHSKVVSTVSFSSMKSSGGVVGNTLLRKGGIGDWRNHLGPEEWGRFDSAFDAALEGVSLAEPLRHYQRIDVGGLPKPRGEQSVDDDPREWQNFVRHTLVEGRLVRDNLSSVGEGPWVRKPSEFLGKLGGEEHPAEAGRYHLFVSGVCPWATSVRAARALLGLEDVISIDVADGQSGAGWVYLSGTKCPPWDDRPGPFFLHEVYQASDPLGTNRITMPVLYDKKLQKIVSNDSWSILKMFATAFRGPGDQTPDLYPQDLAAGIEETHASLYDSLLNGVYKAGVNFARGNKDIYSLAAEKVYSTLEELEEKLKSRRFLMGGAITAVDLRLIMTLLRYDSSYRGAFQLQGGRGGILVGEGYPTLQGYVRDVYAMIKTVVDWPSFFQYYRWGVGLPRDQPLPDLAPIIASAEQPHGRV
eukprot:Hpha_TRINITY_DN11156_c0_g1::TRINITY_DN11156_c0_g1_i2::g.28070::m.28070/K07393/ECM4, yqjG; glutathionyl-hydroquinone reductase